MKIFDARVDAVQRKCGDWDAAAVRFKQKQISFAE
jgi:hypothetical protein